MKTYALILGILGLTALSSSVSLAAAKAYNIPSGNTNYTGEFQPKQSCSCGSRQPRGSDEERIVGGVEADVNEFPWRCNLRYEKSDGSLAFFCGCSVLNDKYILTAAHCTDAVKGYQIHVDAGNHDLNTDDESENEIIPVAKVNQHPKYNKNTFDNDISILKLSKPLTINRFTSPVCVPYQFRNEEFNKKTVTASGWGTEKEGNRRTPSKLQKVDLPVLTTTQCRQKLGKQITNNMICTYQQGKDTCQGDSGGSIDYKDPNSGKYYAIGITSFGEGCARKDKPGVYAKITQYLGYIDEITADSEICGRN